jgi:hypothetical protein
VKRVLADDSPLEESIAALNPHSGRPPENLVITQLRECVMLDETFTARSDSREEISPARKKDA